MRFLLSLAMVGFCLPCMAQSKFLEVGAGKRFIVKGNVVAITSILHIGDFVKSMKAGDDAGLNKMEDDDKILRLKDGLKLVVLEVVNNKFVAPAEYVECTVVKDEKALGKVYILRANFHVDVMSSADEPAPKEPDPKPAPEAPKPNDIVGIKFIRTWTSSDGSFKVEAEFISLGGGKVKLRRIDSKKEIQVELNKLSDDDRKWIENRWK